MTHGISFSIFSAKTYLLLAAWLVGAAMLFAPAAQATADTSTQTTGKVSDSADGAALYATCAACHGKDGSGLRDGTVPAIGGQPAAVILKALEDFRAARRVDLRMQHFADAEHLPGPGALQAIANHVAGLQRVTVVAQGTGTHLDTGRREFARACAACHGPAGAPVASRGIPALAGQHATYLERKLREAMLPGTTLARSHGVIVARLADGQAAAIADWLSRQPGP